MAPTVWLERQKNSRWAELGKLMIAEEGDVVQLEASWPGTCTNTRRCASMFSSLFPVSIGVCFIPPLKGNGADWCQPRVVYD